MSRNSPSGLRPDVGVVIPAGGRGERVGGGVPKQFRELAGVAMLLRTIRPFSAHPDVRSIVVVLPEEHALDPPAWLAELAGDRLRIVAGDTFRAGSVKNGFLALPAECGVVLVHDAARPLVSTDTIDAVIDAVRAGTCAVAACPVADTLKKVRAGTAEVASTVDRRDVWRAQTPQGFPRPVLLRVYGSPPDDFDTAPPTDEASLVERVGESVSIVPDSPWNIKVTSPEDFGVAERLLRPWTS